tara:strand:- start:6085 stop:6711 length:627 start_codon:yes stop_codon:yes gene_type:complete
MSNYSVFIGLDPGVSGGLSIIDGDNVSVFPIPVKEVVVNKKKKKKYSLTDISDILRPYGKKKVLFAQERVSVRPNEGGVSAFGFGFSAGSTLGIATALKFDIIEITPRKWKKHYPELETEEIIELREQLKEVRSEAKSIKEKELKKENQREQDKIGRKIKSIAKTEARMLASRKCPSLKDHFVKVNQDGMAEGLLIAIYAQENYDKLV